jgi:hypothetical protein
VTDETELPPGSDQPHGPAWQPPPSTWSDPSRRYVRSADEHGLPPMPLVHPPRKYGTRLSIAIAVIAVVGLGAVIGVLESGGGKKQTPAASGSSASALSTGSSTAGSGSVAATEQSSSVALPSDPIAPPATSAGRPGAVSSGTRTVHVTPRPRVVTTTASVICHPVKPIIGTCYLVGEACPSAADHGKSGISIDGQPMTCVEENGGWIWKAS